MSKLQKAPSSNKASFFQTIFRYTLLPIIRFFKSLFTRLARMFRGWKDHPRGVLRGLMSAIVPGSGQIRNKQWYKGVPILALFLVVIGIELGTSGYFGAAADMEKYPIITADLLDGGRYYQKYRTQGTIINGYYLQEEDVAEGGDFYQEYRQTGDLVSIDSVATQLTAEDVASDGDFFQSYYMKGDIVSRDGINPPKVLTETDVKSGGDHYLQFYSVGDITFRTLLQADVNVDGEYYQSFRRSGDTIRYSLVASDLWPAGTYHQVQRQPGDVIRHDITAEDLLPDGYFYNSGKVEGDIVMVALTAGNLDLFEGYLEIGDVRGGTLLTEGSAEFRKTGDIVFDIGTQKYKALTSANVNTLGATYYQSPYQAGDIVSADGLTPPILMTNQLVAPQGAYFGSGFSVGKVVKITLTDADVSVGGTYFESFRQKGDSLSDLIDEIDLTPNQIDLKTDEGVYLRSLGVQADNMATEIYFFRDYGGWFTKGIWNLITLGELPLEVPGAGQTDVWYRGWQMNQSLSQNESSFPSWTVADNSTTAMTNGVIVLVVLLIIAVIYLGNIRDAFRSCVQMEKGEPSESPQHFYRRVWDEYFAYIIVIPTFVLIAFFILIPFIFSFITAFTSWTSSVSVPSELINWSNLDIFGKVFSGNAVNLQYFWNVFSWTLIFAIFASLTCYVAGLIQALVIESKMVVAKKFWRTVFILPWAIPSLVTLLMFRNIFGNTGGLANQIITSLSENNPIILPQIKLFLANLGLYRQEMGTVVGDFSQTYINWFGFENFRLGRLLILVINLWIGYPYFMLLITGTLTSIPADMYEAADIDGATNLQKIRYITIPWILRATTPVIITTLTHNFNNFGVIYFLTGSVSGSTYTFNNGVMTNIGAPNSAPSIYDILISWVYRLAMLTTTKEYNLASVYSIIIFFVVAVFSIINLSRMKSFWEED